MEDVLLKIEKAVLLGLLVLLLMWIGRGSSQKADFSKLAAAVTEEMDFSQMQQGDAQLLRRLYGLNGSELRHWLLYTSTDNMDVEELLLVECISEEQADQAAQAAEKRAEVQKDNFEGYSPEQVHLIEKSVILERDTYLLFVISDQAEEVKDSFQKTF